MVRCCPTITSTGGRGDVSRTFDTTLNIVCVEDFNYVNSFGMSFVFFFYKEGRGREDERMRGKEGERI